MSLVTHPNIRRASVRFLCDCPIVSNEEIAPGHYRMRLWAPEIAQAACPGQFAMVRVAPGYSPFLRRPMCFERILPDGLQILYKVAGEGTALMARMVPPQTISVQGPLGNGFPIEPSYPRHIIVAGGIGVAAFPGLAEALVQACGSAPEVVLAARSKHLLLCEKEFHELGCTVHLATDDGSAGTRAYACEMLDRLSPGSDTRVYACGPMIMMRTTYDVARKAGADCLVSLEAQMACGDGACLGCVVESVREREGDKMVRVCVDGPVFDARLIDWEAHDYSYDI